MDFHFIPGLESLRPPNQTLADACIGMVVSHLDSFGLRLMSLKDSQASSSPRGPLIFYHFHFTFLFHLDCASQISPKVLREERAQ
jgi:hypothetical protein